jgi:hypothetical protein
MTPDSHRYYCQRCDRFLYGALLADIVSAVNIHASCFHPSDFSKWTEKDIILSAQYTCIFGEVPPYLLSQGIVAASTVVTLPEITAADKEMLAKGKVRWD